MKGYVSTITGATWTEAEIRKEFEESRHESDYMSGFDSFEDYISEQLKRGTLRAMEERA